MRRIRNEEGYTLVESLVAMALFVGVLIPLLGIMGNLMFDRRNVDSYRALHVAESEMNRIVSTHDFSVASSTIENGFSIDRHIEQRDQLVQIRVSVASAKKPEQQLVQLNRTVLFYGSK
jgi:hypothetical protein